MVGILLNCDILFDCIRMVGIKVCVINILFIFLIMRSLKVMVVCLVIK